MICSIGWHGSGWVKHEASPYQDSYSKGRYCWRCGRVELMNARGEDGGMFVHRPGLDGKLEDYLRCIAPAKEEFPMRKVELRGEQAKPVSRPVKLRVVK